MDKSIRTGRRFDPWTEASPPSFWRPGILSVTPKMASFPCQRRVTSGSRSCCLPTTMPDPWPPTPFVRPRSIPTRRRRAWILFESATGPFLMQTLSTPTSTPTSRMHSAFFFRQRTASAKRVARIASTPFGIFCQRPSPRFCRSLVIRSSRSALSSQRAVNRPASTSLLWARATPWRARPCMPIRQRPA